jgi:pimeloyl-ACP methyl ester carboxylesterase
VDHFERDGLRFGVVDTGPRGRETVVLLHGFPQQQRSYKPLAERLNAAGLRTLIPNQRGYVRTARPKRRRAYATVQVAADVIALLDAAGLHRAHVVGHDWGGTQAWGATAWYPDRVASLTILSTPHPAAARASPWSWHAAFYQLPFLPESLAALTLGRVLRGTELPVKYINFYLDAMADRPTFTGGLNWYRGIPYSRRPAVGQIRVSTTYVWGNRDFAVNRLAAELTADYVTGPYEFRELNSGHWLPEAEPDATSTAILDRVATSPP